jgi:hypothetical protein
VKTEKFSVDENDVITDNFPVDKIIFRTNITITLNSGGTAYYGYTCFVFTSVNTYSYYYYQNTREYILFVIRSGLKRGW